MSFKDIAKEFAQQTQSDNKSIENHYQIPLEPKAQVLNDITSLPESIAYAVAPKGTIDKQDLSNFILRTNRTEGNPYLETLDTIGTGMATEAIREPLSKVVEQYTKKLIGDKLAKGISFGSTTTAESAAWSLPSSIEQDKEGNAQVNKEALLEGTLLNEVPALTLGYVHKKLSNNDETLTNIDASKNMINFTNEEPTYQQKQSPSEYDTEILKDSIKDNDVDTIKGYLQNQYGTDIKHIKIKSLGSSEDPAWYEPQTDTLVINKDSNHLDKIDTILSHELSHKSYSDNNIPHNPKIDEFFAYADSINNEKDPQVRTQLLNAYIDRYAKDYQDPTHIDNRLVSELYNLATGKQDLYTLLKNNKDLVQNRNMIDFTSTGSKYNKTDVTDNEKQFLAKAIQKEERPLIQDFIKNKYNLKDTPNIEFTDKESGRYEPVSNTIFIKKNQKPEELFQTLEHELVHKQDIDNSKFPINNDYEQNELHTYANEAINYVENNDIDNARRALQELSGNSNIIDNEPPKIDINHINNQIDERIKEINSMNLEPTVKQRAIYLLKSNKDKIKGSYNDFKELSKEDIHNAVETIKSFLEDPESLKIGQNKNNFLKAVDRLRTYKFFTEPTNFLMKKQLNKIIEEAKNSTNKSETIHNTNKFENNILESLLGSDKKIYDDTTKSEPVKQHNTDNISFPKTLKKDLEDKLTTYLKDKYKEIIKAIKEDKNYEKELYNKGIKSKKDLDNVFKQLKDEMIDDLQSNPTEYFKFELEPTGSVRIDKIIPENIEKRLSSILEPTKAKDEKLNDRLEKVQNKVAKELDKEPTNKEQQIESLKKYLKSKQNKKVDKPNKNSLSNVFKKLYDKLQDKNYKFKDKRYEELRKRFKNNARALKEHLNNSFKIIKEVTKKYPEVFFNENGSLDKEAFTRLVTREEPITAEQIIEAMDKLKKEESETSSKKETNNKTNNKKTENRGNDNKFIEHEYLNMQYSTKLVKIISNKLKELKQKAIKNSIKVFESIDFNKIQDAYNKLGVSLPNNKLAYAAGGSKPIHLVALIHEFAHNIFPDLSEKEIVGLTANIIKRLTNETEGLKDKFDITEPILKELDKQSRLFKDNEKEELLIRNLFGNSKLNEIVFGSQSIWSKVLTADKIVSDIISDSMKKLLDNKTIQEFKTTLDKKMPVLIKHILFEANILKTSKAVQELIELKKRLNISKDEFEKVFTYQVKSLENKFGKEDLNRIITSGIIQLRTILDDSNIIKTIKKIDTNKMTKEQIQIILNNLDFRISGSNDSLRIKSKVDYLGNEQIKSLIDKHFGSYEEYAKYRAAYILRNISEKELEETKDIIDTLHNMQSKIVDKDFLVLGYKPYIVKTLSRLSLALTDKERQEMLSKGYKEVESYIFVTPDIDKDISSQFIMFNSESKKTGLTATIEPSMLKQIPAEIKNRATIVKLANGKLRLSIFPKKDTFNKIYASIEPSELLRVQYNTLLTKYMNNKLISLESFKSNISDIVSKEPKQGYELLANTSNNLMNKILETNNINYFIKKEYKDFLMYEEYLPKNEKLSQAVKIYKSLIKRLKGNLTYKSPIAFMSNTMSGITAALYLGVNPKHIPSLITSTFKEYREWKKYENKFTEIASKYGIEKARGWLKTIKKNNVFAEMIYDGEIGSLSNDASILFGSTHDDKALLSFLKKIDNQLGTNNAEKTLSLIRAGLLDKETLIGSYLVNAYSNVDMFSRAIMYKYLKPNIGKEEAIKQINDILVDFRKEQIGIIKDLDNSMIPFLSFALRMQGGILKTIYKHPVTVGSIALAYYILEDNDESDYIGNVRTDSWFLHRMLADPLILKLSIIGQLTNGKLDNLISNTLFPKEYIEAYKVLKNNSEPTSLIGIHTKPEWIK